MTVKRLLRADSTHIRDTEREVLNYNKALQNIYADVKSGAFVLCPKTLESIQSIVVYDLVDIQKLLMLGKIERKGGGRSTYSQKDRLDINWTQSG